MKKLKRANAGTQGGQSSVELLLILPFVFFTLLAIVQVCLTALGGELTYYTAFMGARSRAAGGHTPIELNNMERMATGLQPVLPWAPPVVFRETQDGVETSAPVLKVLDSLAGGATRARVDMPNHPVPLRLGDNDLF